MTRVPPGGRLVGGPFENPRLQHLFSLIRERVPEFGYVDGGRPPLALPKVPLERARVALITTAGCHLRGEPPFRSAELALGDPSYRVLPHDAPADRFVTQGVYVDAKYLGDDLECAFPRRALDALVEEGVVGSAAARHYGFVGGVVWPYPELENSAKEAAALLAEDGVQVAVLAPTCSLCAQSVAVIGRVLDGVGIASVGTSLFPALTRIVGAPRTLAPRFPFGAPLGNPGNGALQRAVLREALELAWSAHEPGQVVPSIHAWRRVPR